MIGHGKRVLAVDEDESERLETVLVTVAQIVEQGVERESPYVIEQVCV
jgi:hypothetical protein